MELVLLGAGINLIGVITGALVVRFSGLIRRPTPRS